MKYYLRVGNPADTRGKGLGFILTPLMVPQYYHNSNGNNGYRSANGGLVAQKMALSGKNCFFRE